MFADPRKVAARRIRRRIKAGAAVALALVAGAFLACKGGGDVEPASPSGPDARPGPGPGARDADGGAPDGASTAEGPGDAGDAATSDAGDAGDDDAGDAGSTALAVRDAGADAAAKAPRVDKREHRKGMPVRDNLVE